MFMEKQDQDLDKLSAIIQKQKAVGISISDELDLQNQMLDDLALQVDAMDSKVHSANRKLKKLK